MLWKCHSEVVGKLFGINTISDFEEWRCVQHQNHQAILFLKTFFYADQDLMRTLTKERRGQSLLRRCWAASGWSTLGRPGAGTGSAGDSVPALGWPPLNSST